MNVCFHGGAGDSKVARSISVIGAFTKNMKAMSLKAKAGAGGGSHPRAWRRARRPEAGGLQRQPQDYKDGSGGAVNASAKIAPAQLQEKADDEHRHDRQLSKGAEEQGGGGKKQEYCDKCCSPLLGDDGTAGEEEEVAGAAAEEERVREWVAEPEPGVLMTLAPRPDGTNRLRRMRFREELFDAWAAQSWWADNYDRIVELYSVVQSDDDDDDATAAGAGVPVTPCQSEEEEEEWTTTGAKSVSPSTSNFSGEPSSGSGSGSAGTVGSPILGLVAEPDTLSGSKPTATTTGIKAAAAQHDDDGIRDQTRTPWREWVEEYEAGVFITVRAYPELRHVELSRERFGEVKARVWWQENKDKLRSLYSF